MFKNLFGKKKDGFYMQADEAQPGVAKQTAKEKKPAPVKAAVAEAPVQEDNLAPAADGVPVAAASETAPPEAPKSKKTSIIKSKKAKAEGQEVEGKKEAKATSKDKKAPEAAKPVAATSAAPVATNFATEYLIKPSSTSSRRRPGANMKGFVAMAREVKK
jgi:hypothetical protein